MKTNPTIQQDERSYRTGQPICECGKGYGSELDGLCTRCRGVSAHEAARPVTRQGYLKKDHMERYNSKRGWFVNAWRIVDAQGVDMVQPWHNKKSEARSTAAALGIELIGELK
jgi:hypothetical protein